MYVRLPELGSICDPSNLISEFISPKVALPDPNLPSEDGHEAAVFCTEIVGYEIAMSPSSIRTAFTV